MPRLTWKLSRRACATRASSHQGLQVETCVRRGKPGTEIIVAAAEHHADLVIMTTHGRSGLARAFLGSVAQRVVATSPVPVLLLRPGGHLMSRLGVILVAVDGSLGGALGSPHAWARALHCVFTSLTACLRPATDCATSPPYAELHRGPSESR